MVAKIGTLRPFDVGLLAAAVFAIALSLWQLAAAERGVTITRIEIQGTPATVFAPAGGGPTPVVVIAHGFAGSQQLMRSFALAFARNGVTAITFDSLGHGRNPAALTGDLGAIEGATEALKAEVLRVVDHARAIGDGDVALLGHSMASDIVVRAADELEDAIATVAVSMFSPAVTAATPRNLLVIVGDWEPGLKAEALRAVGLAIAPRAAQPGVTYGGFAEGTARRAAFSPHVEHATVLFSAASLSEAVAWVAEAAGRPLPSPVIDARGPWLALLIAALVAIVRPLSPLLPVVADPPAGLGLPWRDLWKALAAAAVATPLILRFMPNTVLPVLVADYLVMHLAVFGALLAASARILAGRLGPFALSPRLAVAALLLALATTGLLLPAIDANLLSFWPTAHRLPLVAALFCGTLPFFAALEWVTRAASSPRGAYAAGQAAFLLSLALAIGLDFERLFFLIIIVPAIVIFFVITSLYSRWSWRRTGHPLVAALANALLFALAIGVTFPLVAA
jgi:dienelactone hydrolase